MLSLEAIKETLELALPSEHHVVCGLLARVIYDYYSNNFASEDVQAHTHASVVSIFEALAGKSLRLNNSVVGFGEGNRFGEVKINDVAGRDIIKMSVNLTLPSISQILQPVPPFYRIAVQRMVEDYTVIFGGRDEEMALLDTWLQTTSKPFGFIHAPTGRGKSALLIHWVARVDRMRDIKVVFAPISIRYETASVDRTLIALATALAEIYSETEAVRTYTTNPEHLRPLIADYLRRVPPNVEKVLIVIDGLDEAVGWQVKRDLFPRTPSPHLKVLATAREKANTSINDWLYQLGWEKSLTQIITLSNLGHSAVSDILSRMGHPLDSLSTDIDVLGEIARVSQGDPLTIRFLIEGLQHGSITPGRLVRLPVGLEAYIRDWLDELEQYSSETEAVYTLLRTCAIALGPLTIEDILQIEPEIFRKRLTLNQAATRVARFIIGDGSGLNGYAFSHGRLREVFLERVLSDNERNVVLSKFISYGKDKFEESNSRIPVYVRQFWIAHLFDAGDVAWVVKAITEFRHDGNEVYQPWADMRWKAEGNYAGYLNDLGRLLQFSIESRQLLLVFKCLLISSSIRSQI